MKLSFRLKLFLTFVTYGFILVFITQIVLLKINTDAIKSTSIKKASSTFDEKNKQLKSFINNADLKLLTFTNSSIFNEYLTNHKNIELVSSLFLDIAHTSDDIIQLRYIDKNGIEKIRIDRDKTSSKLFIVDENDLQDKSNRYYFKDILNTPKGSFWYSNVDLNIEYAKIEQPIKPVIRIGMPVYSDKQKDGILIINIFMKDFLHKLIDSSINKLYIFDKDGNILVSSQDKECWSKYLDKNLTLFTQFKNEADVILNSKEYFGANFYSNILDLENGENLRMIIEPRTNYIQQEIDEHLSQLLLIMLGVVLVSIPFSFLFAIAPSKLRYKILEQKKEQDILLSLFDLSDTVLIKWSNDTHWSVASASKSIYKLLGYSEDDFISNRVTYESIIHKDDVQKVKKEIRKAMDNDDYFFTHTPYRVISKDGSIKWIYDSTILVKDDNDKLINFVGYLSDITKLKNSEERFKVLSRTDQLTNIYNRMHLDNTLQNQEYRFKRDNESLSVILMDIDHFKSVNDDFGHLIGDSVLVEFANLLQLSIRESDVLGRWGGEEFLIILPHSTLIEAMQLAQKLQKVVEKNIFTTIGHKTASFGVATMESDMTLDNLIDCADKALYRAKDGGRNYVCTTQVYNKVS